MIKIRDNKTYQEAGYSSFREYVEEDLDIEDIKILCKSCVEMIEVLASLDGARKEANKE